MRSFSLRPTLRVTLKRTCFSVLGQDGCSILFFSKFFKTIFKLRFVLIMLHMSYRFAHYVIKNITLQPICSETIQCRFIYYATELLSTNILSFALETFIFPNKTFLKKQCISTFLSVSSYFACSLHTNRNKTKRELKKLQKSSKRNLPI